MKIAIMSDSHDHWDNLSQAVDLANEKECTELWFAGDLVSSTGIKVLKGFKGKVCLVLGNNEGELLGINALVEQTKNISFSKKLSLKINRGSVYEAEIDGLKIFMNHYQQIAEIAAKSNEYDVVVYGHDHKYFEGKINNCLILNPGEICGTMFGTPTFAILNTKTKKIEKILLNEKNEKEKKLKAWEKQKEGLAKRTIVPKVKVGEIRWVYVGENIGHEQNGTGTKFARPVIVIRRSKGRTFWGIPLTTQTKEGFEYFPIKINNQQQTAVLHQTRLFDARRVSDCIEVLPVELIQEVKTAFKNYL